MISYFDSVKQLIDKLFQEANGRPHCEHIRRDKLGWPYCGKCLEKDVKPSLVRRAPCDTYSLQLWCLADKKRHKKCIWYQKNPLVYSNKKHLSIIFI